VYFHSTLFSCPVLCLQAEVSGQNCSPAAVVFWIKNTQNSALGRLTWHPSHNAQLYYLSNASQHSRAGAFYHPCKRGVYFQNACEMRLVFVRKHDSWSTHSLSTPLMTQGGCTQGSSSYPSCTHRVCEKKIIIGTLVFSLDDLFEVGNNCIGWLNFQAMSKLKQKKWVVNCTTPLNFKKFHKVEFNSEFNESTTTGFIKQFYFLEMYILSS